MVDSEATKPSIRANVTQCVGIGRRTGASSGPPPSPALGGPGRRTGAGCARTGAPVALGLARGPAPVARSDSSADRRARRSDRGAGGAANRGAPKAHKAQTATPPGPLEFVV